VEECGGLQGRVALIDAIAAVNARKIGKAGKVYTFFMPILHKLPKIRMPARP
jgi:hypothetical protein